MIRNFYETLWDRWANLHPLLRFLILAATLAVLGLLATQPGYRAFKAWRVECNLVAARKAVAEVRMDDARDLSRSVLQTGDPRIEALQILEKSTAALRDPQHGDIARVLMSHPQSTDEDRLIGFRGMAPAVALGLLGKAWNTLPPSCQTDPRFAALFADRLLAEHRLNEALSVLQAVPESARTSAVEARLIRVLISSGKSEGYDEAQRLIADKITADTADLTEWLGLLEAIPALSLRNELSGKVRKVLENPPVGSEGRMALMLARMDYAADFSRRVTVLDAAIDRWHEQDPQALADFLGDLGLYQRLLDTFPVERLEQHPELFARLLEAMERSGAWEKAVLLLDACGQHLPKFEASAHRTVAAAKTGKDALRVVSWSAAMGEANASPVTTAYLTLERLAREAGLLDEAEQAMVAAIRLGRGPLPLYEQLKPLLNSLARQGRDGTLLEICSSYLAFEPDNPVLLTQFAYLSCLNNAIDFKTTLKAMEALAAGFPEEATIQCVLATAYLCDGQTDKAAAALDRLKLDPAQLSLSCRAAYLTTQVLNHRLAKNDPSVTGFPWKSLLPSERRRFNDLIRTAKP